MPQARMVILRSPNGRDQWEMVKPDDVPAWVTDPDRLGMLVNGHMCNDPTEGKEGYWWRAEVSELVH